MTGVYGLTADLSRRAMREIGIRKALGATTADVVRSYVFRPAGPAVPALVLGGLDGTAGSRARERDRGCRPGVAPSHSWMTLLVATSFGALVIIASHLATGRTGCESGLDVGLD